MTTDELGKLQELSSRIPSRNVKVYLYEEELSRPRYSISVDDWPIKGGTAWTYDQAWCILVGMRSV